MNMYEQFKTDATVETTGVWADYQSFRVRLARAGGANKAYQNCIERLSRPYRKAISRGTMSNDRMLAILQQAMIEAVIVDWEVKRGGEWVKGMDDPSGSEKPIPFNPANVKAALDALPDLSVDLQEQANSQELYRANVSELSAKN